MSDCAALRPTTNRTSHSPPLPSHLLLRAAQIGTAPTDHPVALRVRPVQHYDPQFLHLRFVQCQRSAGSVWRPAASGTSAGPARSPGETDPATIHRAVCQAEQERSQRYRNDLRGGVAPDDAFDAGEDSERAGRGDAGEVSGVGGQAVHPGDQLAAGSHGRIAPCDRPESPANASNSRYDTPIVPRFAPPSRRQAPPSSPPLAPLEPPSASPPG